MAAAVKVTALIEGVLALIRMERNDPCYPQQAQAVLDLCTAALDPSNAPQNETRKAATLLAVTAAPGNLSLRIAELAAQGKGVREIARNLGMNASTVSGRLRTAMQASATPDARRSV